MCFGELILDGLEKEKDFIYKLFVIGIIFDLDICIWFKVIVCILFKDIK